jgi:hypothetical protein
VFEPDWPVNLREQFGRDDPDNRCAVLKFAEPDTRVIVGIPFNVRA